MPPQDDGHIDPDSTLGTDPQGRWRVQRLPGHGRSVRATQPLDPGATLLDDTPAAAVVSDPYRNVGCAACLLLCTERIFVCGGCQVTYYCSSECVARDAAAVHAGKECRALAGLAKLGVEGDSQAMRLALRLACLNENEKEEPSSSSSSSSPFHTRTFVQSLEHHLEDMQPVVYKGTLAVAQALAGLLEGTDTTTTTTTTTTTMARLLGVIQSNAHAIRDEKGQVLGLGLFPLASMLNHSCQPNAHHVFALSPGQGPPRLVFHTLHRVAEGEELVYSYTDLMRPRQMRRATLLAAYYFSCDCPRCQGAESVSVLDWALESAACVTAGCRGVLRPPDEGSTDEFVCLRCGEREDAFKVRSRQHRGEAWLEPCIKDLQRKQVEEGSECGALSEAALDLADLLFWADHTDEEQKSLRLHARHWRVYHAVLTLSHYLASLQPSCSGTRIMVAWLHLACEMWALESLWAFLGACCLGRHGSDKRQVTCHHPELGQRLIAAGKARQTYDAAGLLVTHRRFGDWRCRWAEGIALDLPDDSADGMLVLGKKLLQASGGGNECSDSEA